jgi:hypothetical protein
MAPVARSLVAVLLVALAVTAGCSKDAGDHDAFCTDLRTLQRTSQTLPKIDPADAEGVKQRYEPVADLLDDATGDAPESVRGDVERLATYFDDVVTALGSVDPDDPGSSYDALKTATGKDPSQLRSSSSRIQTYAQTSCGLPPPSSTTTVTVAPG